MRHNEVSFIVKAGAEQKVDHLLHRKMINLRCALTFMQNKKRKENIKERESRVFDHTNYTLNGHCYAAFILSVRDLRYEQLRFIITKGYFHYLPLTEDT